MDMLQKTDERCKDIPGFARWGCYVACECSYAEKNGGSLSKADVEYICAEGKNKHWIEGNFWVAEPVKLFNLILARASCHQRIRSVEKSQDAGPDFVIICYKTSGGHHFVLGDEEGNVVINPDPTVKLLSVENYSVFTLA